MKTLRDKTRTMLILERGEKVVETITKRFGELEITGGMISGLGAVTDIELGFYHLHKKEYTRKTFGDEYELLAMAGNVALKDGKPFVHVHAALGREDFSAFGGHVFEARVAATVEISVVTFEFKPQRLMVPEIGLSLICGEA